MKIMTPKVPATTRTQGNTRAFRCRPMETGCRAKCCGVNDSRPMLYGADFLALAKNLGRPVASVWRERGDVCFFPGPDVERELSVELSLLHDPCPFLATEPLGCQQYEARPLNCVAFPILALQECARDPLQLSGLRGHYPCLVGMGLSDAQNDFGARVWTAMVLAKQLDLEYIFNGQAVVYLKRDASFFERIINGALSEAQVLGAGFRTNRFFTALNAYQKSIQQNLGHEHRADRYTNLLAAAYYLLIGEAIAYQLEGIEAQHMSAYAECLRQFEVLRRAMP